MDSEMGSSMSGLCVVGCQLNIRQKVGGRHPSAQISSAPQAMPCVAVPLSGCMHPVIPAWHRLAERGAARRASTLFLSPHPTEHLQPFAELLVAKAERDEREEHNAPHRDRDVERVERRTPLHNEHDLCKDQRSTGALRSPHLSNSHSPSPPLSNPRLPTPHSLSSNSPSPYLPSLHSPCSLLPN
eukprot:366174-Chlamydomonas_euryale.AAC.2